MLKEKKTMRFEQIKKIYMTLTEGMFGLIKARLRRFCFRRIKRCWRKWIIVIISNCV